MRREVGSNSGCSECGKVMSKIGRNVIGKRSGSGRSASEARATIRVAEEFRKVGRVSRQ